MFSDPETIGAVLAVLAVGAIGNAARQNLAAHGVRRRRSLAPSWRRARTECYGLTRRDESGRCNQAAAQIFGCTTNELTGKRIHSVIPSLIA